MHCKFNPFTVAFTRTPDNRVFIMYANLAILAGAWVYY